MMPSTPAKFHYRIVCLPAAMSIQFSSVLRHFSCGVHLATSQPMTRKRTLCCVLRESMTYLPGDEESLGEVEGDEGGGVFVLGGEDVELGPVGVVVVIADGECHSEG